MFSGPDFEESYLNIWSLLPAAAKSVLFCLRHVKLYYHANQIWHVCNNLLDAMVHSVPYGNCFSWLKKNSQTLREERTLQKPMVNNKTMLSEFAWHSFRNSVFNEKRRRFFFYSWLVSFSSFLFFYRQEKDVSHWHYQQFKMYERITVSKNYKHAHLHLWFVLTVCFVGVFGENLSKIGSSWDYNA